MYFSGKWRSHFYFFAQDTEVIGKKTSYYIALMQRDTRQHQTYVECAVYLDQLIMD